MGRNRRVQNAEWGVTSTKGGAKRRRGRAAAAPGGLAYCMFTIHAYIIMQLQMVVKGFIKLFR